MHHKVGEIMVRQKKMLNITMLEGTANGPILCNLKPGHSSIYKISREALADYKKLDDMNKPGIYFLCGKGGHIYVGQANERMNGQGIWLRVSEHNKEKESYWTEAFMVIRKTDDLTATDLNYLENRFCNIVMEAGATVHNKKNPSMGKYSDETEVMLEPFIDEVIDTLKLLGYNIFDKVDAPVEETQRGVKLFLNKSSKEESRNVDAKILMADGKFILLKGSIVATKPSNKCQERILRKRAEYDAMIDTSGRVKADIEFDSSSTLAQVATISSVNGKVELKDANGVTLKALLGE
ncbi:MAG: GIY-YIG nuclease family protein [Dorea sp.]|nr:GIY-YIG nuclease family protein [Dorea sp.]